MNNSTRWQRSMFPSSLLARMQIEATTKEMKRVDDVSWHIFNENMYAFPSRNSGTIEKNTLMSAQKTGGDKDGNYSF